MSERITASARPSRVGPFRPPVSLVIDENNTIAFLGSTCVEFVVRGTRSTVFVAPQAAGDGVLLHGSTSGSVCDTRCLSSDPDG